MNYRKVPTYPSHETVETMSTKTVSREPSDVRVLLSLYANRDGNSISSEPLQEEKFSVPISDESPRWGGGGGLYITSFTGMLCPKGVTF